MPTPEILNETMRKLEALPPGAGHWKERRPLLETLDALFGESASENDPDLCEFYRRRCRRAIAEIRGWNGPGVRLWKLYSSAVIVKDGDGKVTAFDLNDGCTPVERRARLRLDAALAGEFAGLIDTAFYTHGHLDHLGLGVADALLASGKTVIAPAAAVRTWLLHNAIPAEECNRGSILSYGGVQRIAGADDMPNAAYLVTFPPGVTLFVRGDIYCGEDLLPILDRLEAEHCKIDYAATSPFRLSGPDPTAELDRRFHCKFVPIHEWEFGHRRPDSPGRATQNYADLYGSFRTPGEDGRCEILGWGESIPLAKTTEAICLETTASQRRIYA